MTEKVFQNNQAVVAGEVVSDFSFSHELYGEGFYNVELKVDRLSDTYDMIPVMISERIINVQESYIGRRLEVRGQFRSYNKHEDLKNRLILSLFAREVRELEEGEEYSKPNQIFLDGFICKKPVYRKTPLGREISDILLAVNRAYGKSDYIPCICWGRNAKFAQDLEVGSHIQLWGRIQSRQYQKKIGEDQVINRTAYEISVSKIECDRAHDHEKEEDSMMQTSIPEPAYV